MEWKYVKSLKYDKGITNVKKIYNMKISKYLKDIIMKYNGGRPLKNIFDTTNSK